MEAEIPAGFCRNEKGAPMVGGKFWTFNPNSEYNKMNFKEGADLSKQH
jgi:hypothetical protein